MDEFDKNYPQELKVLEEKYQAIIRGKDLQIEAQKKEIEYLRGLISKLSKTPIVIDLSQD